MKTKQRLAMIIAAVLLVLLGSSLTVGTEVDTIIIQTPPTVGALPLIWMKEQGVLADKVELISGFLPIINGDLR